MQKILLITTLLVLTSSIVLNGQTFEINNESITTCTGSFQDDNGGIGDAPGTEGGPYSNTSYTYTICPDVPGDVIQINFSAFNLYTNLNLIPLQVLVSTIPVFQTDYTETICLGGTGFVDGNPVQSQTWTALPPQVVSGETYLADGAGFSYESSIPFDFFEEDQVLESCDDLYGISVNMEHSYMGDLDILITCPNGTSLFLFQQAGGGTFLGEAVDDGSTAPGVGYDYIWSPTATNGTWGENAGGVNILPAGTYESNEDMCQLEGCPLNGEWTIEVIDNLAIDNGYIFEWGIDLNPELFPGITTFTPEIGLGLDSTWIEGPNITGTSEDGNYTEITPPSLGTYDYSLFATNNFGCTFDTIITVECVPGPVVNAGLDLQICNDPVDLDAVITSNDFAFDPCSFTLELINNDGFGFNNSSVDVYFDGVLFNSFASTNVSQESQIQIPSGSTMTLEYVFSTWGEGTGNVVSLFNDLGELVFESDENPSEGVIFEETVICAGAGQLQWEWSPADGLSNPFIPNPEVNLAQSIDYTVTVYPQGFEGCASTDVVSVTVDPAGDPGTDSTLVLCYNYGSFNLINMLGGNPVNTGEWTNGNGDAVNGDFNTLTDLGDTFTYTVLNNGCLNTAQVDITVIPQGDPICCEFDYEYSSTDALCNASSDGTFSITMESSTDGGPWQIELSLGMNVLNQEADNFTSFTGLSAGNYTVTIIDAGLCQTSFEVEVLEPPIIPIQAVADSTICLTGVATLEAWSSADENSDFVYSWLNLGDGVQQVSPDVLTTYSVYATSPNGCQSPTEDVVIDVHEPLSLQVSPDQFNCQNQLDTLEVTSESGGFGGFFYNWTLNGNSVGTDESLNISPVQTLEYCITLTDGCETPEIQDCILVNVEPTPEISLFSSNPSGCEPFSVYFENQTDADLYVNTYWNLEEANYSPENSTTHEYLTPGIYDVSMTLESDLGCFYEANYPNYVTVFASPEPAFIWSPFNPTIPETEIEFNNLTEGFITSYYWEFDTLNIQEISELENPTFEFPINEGGEYPTSLTVTDINGCEATQTFTVVINDPLNLYVPSAFTPNTDGANDVFKVEGTDVDAARYQIWIFNRLGEIVYYSQDLKGVWDGSFNGGEYYVQPGVYTYRIDYYSLSTTQRYEKNGHVTVVR